MMAGYIIIGIVLFLLTVSIALYNTLTKRRNETDNAFGSMEVMLKKRYDLIPNLVETVKQYMIHESTVLKDVTNLRTGYNNMTSNDKVELHNKISKKIKDVMLTVENYPDLKANQNFLKLQASWNETEEQISAARRFYNSAVTKFNNSIQTFPSNLIALAFNFKLKKVFEIDEDERTNINAKKLFDS